MADACSRQAGIQPVELESCGGDVVLLGKHVWHTVDTLEASVSLAADRLLADQLRLLGATVRGFEGKPLIPSKWCVAACMLLLACCILDSRVQGHQGDGSKLGGQRAAWRGFAGRRAAQHARRVCCVLGASCGTVSGLPGQADARITGRRRKCS